jgi:hypothetical protein
MEKAALVMVVDSMYDVIMQFNRKWRAATTGLYLPKEKCLLTGHQTGYVIKHNTESKISEEIQRIPGGRITAFSQMPNGSLVVSSESGGLYRIDLEDIEEHEELIAPTNMVSFRIRNMATPRNEEVFIGQTYGSLRRIFKTKSNTCDVESILRHSDSMFGLDSSYKLLVSGDWRG